MMTRVLGVMPMAGSGSRLGLPFPKPLAPTFTTEGIRPLFWHASSRLHAVSYEVLAVVAEEDIEHFRNTPFLSGFISKTGGDRGTATGSVKFAAEMALGGLDDVFDTIAIALPDSIWYPKYAFRQALQEHNQSNADITLLTMYGKASQLDHVSDAHGIWVEPHENEESTNMWNGWFALVGKTEVLAHWKAHLSWSENINRTPDSRLRQTGFSGQYFDLGTPERYEQYIGVDKLL